MSAKEAGPKVVFINEAVPFPYGLASSSRLRLLAQAIVEGGGTARVLVVRPVVPKDVNDCVVVGRHGAYESVSYEYLCGFPRRPNGFIRRQFLKTLGYAALPIRLLGLRSRGELDVVVLYTRRLVTIRAVAMLLRLMRTPVVLEVCEWPLAQVAAKGGDVRRAAAYCRHARNSVDGAIAISRFIERELGARGESIGGCPRIIRVPALVDAALPPSVRSVSKDVVLCTSFSYRTMVDAVLRAMPQILRALPEARLCLLGGLSPDSQKRWVRSRIAELGLEQHVDLQGFVSDERLSEIYSSALVLLAPLEDTDQSHSRFPNKIPEYLASGRPVITNEVGDLPLYLTHGDNVWFAENTDSESLAEAVLAVALSGDFAERIGAGGREAAVRSFHFGVYSADLVAFMEGMETRWGNGCLEG